MMVDAPLAYATLRISTDNDNGFECVGSVDVRVGWISQRRIHHDKLRNYPVL